MASGKVWSQKLMSQSKYQPKRRRQLALDDGGVTGRKFDKSELLNEMAHRAAFQIANETLATKTMKVCDVFASFGPANHTWLQIMSNTMTIAKDAPTVPTGANNRVGNKIRVKQLAVSFYVSDNIVDNQSFTQEQTSSRLIIFLDKSPNGGAPAVANLLELNTQAAGTYNINAQYNMAFLNRFAIMYDKTYTVKSPLADGSNALPHYWHESLIFPLDFMATYKDLPLADGLETGDVTFAMTNRIFGMLYNSNGATYNMLTRVYFEDAQD